MKILRFLAIFCLLLGLTASAVNAQSVSTKVVDMPWNVFISCSGEFGELAVGTLNLHTVIHYDSDGVITKSHNQPQGGELVGEITGSVFHPTGVTQSMTKSLFANGAYTSTYLNIFHMVGPGVQYKVKTLYHVTINANGEVTAEIDETSVECK